MIRTTATVAEAAREVIGRPVSARPAARADLRSASERARFDLLFASSDEVVRASGAEVARGRDADGELVAGAIPFNGEAGTAALFRPESFERGPPGRWAAAKSAPRGEFRISAMPGPDEYTCLVSQVVAQLRGAVDAGAASGGGAEGDGADTESLRKVVLARRLDVRLDQPIDVERLVARLSRDRHVTTLLLRTLDEAGAPGPAVVGASPELLVEKRGASIWSVPLAGSARRSRHRPVDEVAARRLRDSAKEQEEHRLVVEHVLDTLAPLCESVRAAPEPTLSRTATMWHLATRVEGRLRDPETPSLLLARRLHPTPAVCGVPTPAAARVISELEPFDRGFYGGAVGWSDGPRDGRWVITIRCAEVSGSRASLYAGAGILPDSDPAAECDETSAKFRTLLTALGLAEGA